jgi:hypothetical protein
MQDTHVAKRKVDCTHCPEEIRHGLQASKFRFMEYNCEVCHSAIHGGPKEIKGKTSKNDERTIQKAVPAISL